MSEFKNPLLGLIGTWEGDKGVDLAPKPEEDENNPYYETLVIEPVDIDIENAEEQELLAVRYTQTVREKANDKVSHSEAGFWIWEVNTERVMCSFSIPRGLSLIAGGKYKASGNLVTFNVEANQGDPNYGIVQSPFLEKKATTKGFKREFVLESDTLSYIQETSLDIYGKDFNHKDINTLKRVK